MVLHLVVVMLFQQYTGCAIHVSGKILSKVIQYLQKYMPTEQYVQLSALEQLVIQQHRLSLERGRECIGKEITADEEGRIEQEVPLKSAEAENTPEVSGLVSDITNPEENQRSLLDSLKQIVIIPGKTVQ